MFMSINNSHQISFKGLFFFFVVVFIATLHPFSPAGSNGNVEQWMNITNQAFYGNQDFLFSYGPLFWLTGGTPAQYSLTTYWLSIAFLSGVHAVFWAAIVSMALETRTILFFSGLFLLFIGSLVFLPALFLWPFLLVVYLDRFGRNKSAAKTYFLLGMLVAFEFYVRFYWGLVALATLGSYLFSCALADKKISAILQLLAGWFISYILLGLLIFHDYKSLLDYIVINNQLSFGNSVDMTLDVVNRPGTWLAVAAVFIAFNVYAALARKYLWITINVLLLLFLKVGFSRTDHYLEHFIPEVAILLILPALDKSALSRATLVVVATCLYYLAVIPSFPGAPVRKPFRASVDFNVDYASRMQTSYGDFKLSQDLLDVIGKGKIDVYPYNNEYAFANKLNYKHRPSFQNYMTLTPKLDSMNQLFFESDERPQFILWTGGITCGTPACNPFDSFDGKYSLNEDPLTSSAILLNYHVVKEGVGRAGTRVVLLEKNQAISRYAETPISTQENMEFGKWYKAPASNGALLKLKPEFKLTLYGRLRNLLFRGEVLKVKYLLPSGETKEYRANILNAGSGVIVSPLPDKLDFGGAAPTHIMFEMASRRYFAPSFNAEWVAIPVTSLKVRPLQLDARSDSAPKHDREKVVACDGAVDSINNESSSSNVLSITGNLNARGWLAASTSTGELFDQVFVVVTDSKGKQSYITTRTENRDDLSAVFRHENLKSAGYQARIDASFVDGPATLGLAGLKGSTLYRCSQFAAKFSVAN
jgi:hypothetical protein